MSCQVELQLGATHKERSGLTEEEEGAGSKLRREREAEPGLENPVGHGWDPRTRGPQRGHLFPWDLPHPPGTWSIGILAFH